MATKSDGEKPDPDLKTLETLVGSWKLGGDTDGIVTYEWMEGSFFLLQHFNFNLFGKRICGIEVIGHLKSFDGTTSSDIRTRSYDNSGNTFDYVYEMEGNTLIIWGGEKGSSSYFKGTFSPDGTTNTGAWVWPGGGYKTTMKRIANGSG